MVRVYDTNFHMEKIAVSKFKATCLAVIERVNRTGETICVTKFGKPLAEIKPVRAEPSSDWLGSGIGTAEIAGDILEPSDDLDAESIVREWDELASKSKARGRSATTKPKEQAR